MAVSLCSCGTTFFRRISEDTKNRIDHIGKALYFIDLPFTKNATARVTFLVYVHSGVLASVTCYRKLFTVLCSSQ